MLSFLPLLILTVVAPPVSSVAVAFPATSSITRREDVSFGCACIDHWFQHNRMWIRASSTDGCMTLETVSTYIWALNAMKKPTYTNKFYKNLVCSLSQKRCEWTYSPLDYLQNTTITPSGTTTPACENILEDNTSQVAGTNLENGGPIITERMTEVAVSDEQHLNAAKDYGEDEDGGDED